MATFLYRVAHLGGSRTVYEHPLGSLICIPLMLLGGVLTALLFQRRSLIWIGVFSVFLFGQPYFLENLSYSFDSPLMVLSVVMGLAAAWLSPSSLNEYGVIIAGSLLSLSLLIYQPANNAFWIPICMIVIYSFGNSGPNSRSYLGLNISIKQLLFRALAIEISSLMMYKFIFTPIFVLSDYAQHIQRLPASGEIFSVVLRNFILFCSHITSNSFESSLGIMLIIYIIVSIIFISSQRLNLYGLIQSILFLFVLALSQGLVLTVVVSALSPRTYIGIGVFLASLAPMAWDTIHHFRCLSSITIWLRRIYLGILTATLCGLISCSFAYGSAYRSQNELNAFYRQTIANEILASNLVIHQHITKMAILGQSPLSPILSTTIKSYPYFSDLINSFGGDSRGIRLFKYYGLKLNRIAQSELINDGFTETSSSLVLKRPNYTIYNFKDTVIVSFSKIP